VVSSRACLDADQARRQCFEVSNDIIAAKLAADDRADTIDSVDLKHMLGDIQTNCGNPFHGRLSLM